MHCIQPTIQSTSSATYGFSSARHKSSLVPKLYQVAIKIDFPIVTLIS